MGMSESECVRVCWGGGGGRRVRRMGSWVPGTPLFSLKMQDFASFFENFPGGGGGPRTPPPLKGTGARAWGCTCMCVLQQ